MRLDLQTDRNGPVPEHRPDLGACWLWTGVPVHGYGYIRIGKRKVQAYRVNYERWIGPIPHGAVIDHLCRVRACVRPDHLEPTTYSQNTVRSPIHGSQVKAARGECPAGHPFDERNTYRRPGTNVRQCRACLAENKRRRTGAQPRPRATETHCARGHVWTPPRGKRCPTCNREAGAAFRARDRAARAAG
ncbi:HNH endonuclease [Blastococcus sp. TBT05-19]|nr:HNH endonuclease [Blastococcus sp. TBT05-19]